MFGGLVVSVDGEARFRVGPGPDPCPTRQKARRARRGSGSWREHVYIHDAVAPPPTVEDGLLPKSVSVFARSAQQTLRTLRGIILSEVAASRAHPLAPLEGLTSFGLTLRPASA